MIKMLNNLVVALIIGVVITVYVLGAIGLWEFVRWVM